MSRDDYDDRLLEEIRTIRKAIQRASESDNEREPAQEEIRRRKEEQEKRARIDRRRKAARIERRNKQKEERRRIKEEKLRKWGCQEFCVNGILNHSLTLSPKTMENWLMASPQLRIG